MLYLKKCFRKEVWYCMKKFMFIFSGIPIILIFAIIIGLIITKSSTYDEMIYTTKTYTIQNELTKTDITIEYPFFTDAKGTSITQLNESVYEKSVTTKMEEYYNNTGLYYKGNYSIKLLEEKYISILFESESYLNGAAYPVDDAFGITYNVQKNEIVDLSEIAEKSSLDIIIEKKNFKVIKAVNDFLTDPVFESYMNAESTEGYYITKDSIGLIFRLPHVAGDYAIVEILMEQEPEYTFR